MGGVRAVPENLQAQDRGAGARNGPAKRPGAQAGDEVRVGERPGAFPEEQEEGVTKQEVRKEVRDRQHVVAQAHIGVVRLGDRMHMLRDSRPLAHAHDRIDEAGAALVKAANALLQAEALILLEEQREEEEKK